MIQLIYESVRSVEFVYTSSDFNKSNSDSKKTTS